MSGLLVIGCSGELIYRAAPGGNGSENTSQLPAQVCLDLSVAPFFVSTAENMKVEDLNDPNFLPITAMHIENTHYISSLKFSNMQPTFSSGKRYSNSSGKYGISNFTSFFQKNSDKKCTSSDCSLGEGLDPTGKNYYETKISWKEGGATSTLKLLLSCYENGSFTYFKEPKLADSCFTLENGEILENKTVADKKNVQLDLKIRMEGNKERHLSGLLTMVQENAVVDLAGYSCNLECRDAEGGLAGAFGADHEISLTCQYVCENGTTGSYPYSYGSGNGLDEGQLYGLLLEAQPRGCKVNNISLPTFVPAIDLP